MQDGDGPMQRSTAMKVEHPNQFAPQGINPKEFKEKQKSVSQRIKTRTITLCFCSFCFLFFLFLAVFLKV